MHQPEPILKCRKCGKAINKFKRDSETLFEGMHWLCFHFEYEHEGEPDSACADFSCPNLKIEIFGKTLEAMGVDTEKLIADVIKNGWAEGP